MAFAEQFYRRARSIIAPTLRYSQDVYESVLNSHVHDGAHWLDVGCGYSILPSWRFASEQELTQRAERLVGLDYDLEAIRRHRTVKLRVRGDVSMLPFNSETFDLVSANMVFEHLKEPHVQLVELLRVLRPGGLLIFHTPNRRAYGVVFGRALPDRMKKKLAWLAQDRPAEDVYPTHYRINSEREIRALAERVGFTVKEIRMVVSTPLFLKLPPLVLPELLLLRALMTAPCRALRTNIIAILERPA